MFDTQGAGRDRAAPRADLRQGARRGTTISSAPSTRAVRGSDPDAALYYLARMFDGGEDPLFIARRVVRMAVEDIGLADPQALVVANAAKDAYDFLGSPEGELAHRPGGDLRGHRAEIECRLPRLQGRHEPRASAHGSMMPPKVILNGSTKFMKSGGLRRRLSPTITTSRTPSPARIIGRMRLGRQQVYQPTERGFEREIGRRMTRWRSCAIRRIAEVPASSRRPD